MNYTINTTSNKTAEFNITSLGLGEMLIIGVNYD